jgi:hypothetical protein
MRWTKVTERILIAGAILFCLALAVIQLFPKQPKRLLSARVTFIGPVPSADPYAPTVRILARTEDGRIAQMSVPSNELSCKVGDKIRATSRGASVYLDPSSCADLTR